MRDGISQGSVQALVGVDGRHSGDGGANCVRPLAQHRDILLFRKLWSVIVFIHNVNIDCGRGLCDKWGRRKAQTQWIWCSEIAVLNSTDNVSLTPNTQGKTNGSKSSRDYMQNVDKCMTLATQLKPWDSFFFLMIRDITSSISPFSQFDCSSVDRFHLFVAPAKEHWCLSTCS